MGYKERCNCTEAPTHQSSQSVLVGLCSNSKTTFCSWECNSPPLHLHRGEKPGSVEAAFERKRKPTEERRRRAPYWSFRSAAQTGPLPALQGRPSTHLCGRYSSVTQRNRRCRQKHSLGFCAKTLLSSSAATSQRQKSSSGVCLFSGKAPSSEPLSFVGKDRPSCRSGATKAKFRSCSPAILLTSPPNTKRTRGA